MNEPKKLYAIAHKTIQITIKNVRIHRTKSGELFAVYYIIMKQEKKTSGVKIKEESEIK